MATAPRDFPDDHAGSRAPAVIMGDGETMGYAELAAGSRRFARVLRAAGAARGATVALLMENHPRFLQVAWAAQRAGLRFTTISVRFTPGEVAYILRDAGAVVLITSAECSALARAAADAAGVGVVFCVDGTGDGDGVRSYADAIARVPDAPLDDEAEGVDLLYSSGTTGQPKGVEATLTLAPLGTPTGVAGLLRDRWSFGRDTVYLSPAPMYHAAPLRFSMAVQRFGGTVVVMERFDAEEALALIARHRVTHVQVVPTMMIRLLRLDPAVRARFDLSSLRVLIHAAAPCPPAVKAAMIAWLGPIVHEYYSSTENNLFTTITSEEALERPGSVGRAILGTPRILDDAGAPVPAGVPGTIWAEGGLAFAYRGDAAKTAESRNAQGWSTVGDIGYLDEAGYLYLTDRKADMIIAGGVNVYPREAENVLSVHPKVFDVAVFGIPHAEFGEEVKAVVQAVEAGAAGPALEQELLAYCRERLAGYKCPRSIDFAAELPRHPTGKLYKRKLRDQYRVAAS